MTHTQGPWRVTGKSIRSDNHIDGEGALLLNAGPMFYEYTPDPEEQNANLQLAASAPDLLEALQSLLASLENIDFSHLDYLAREDGDGSVYDRIPWELTEKAIATATGAEVEA